MSAEHGGSLFPPDSIQFHSCPGAGQKKLIWRGLAELGLHIYINYLGFFNWHYCDVSEGFVKLAACIFSRTVY